MKQFSFAAFALGASACQSTSNLHELQAGNPSANDFTSALAAEYQGYAASESELGHNASAQYYAGKGLKALNGEAVAPDDVNAQTNGEDKEHLDTARQLLLGLLTPDMEHVAPQKTAHAQLLFDCWQNNTISGKKSATLCDEEFAATVAELQNIADSFHDTQEMNDTVHFERNHAALNDKNDAIIRAIAGKAKALPATMLYTVELDGHADSYRKPNGELAQARVEAVRLELVNQGIPPERILVATGGEKAVVLSSDEDANQDNIGDVDITLRSKPFVKPVQP